MRLFVVWSWALVIALMLTVNQVVETEGQDTHSEDPFHLLVELTSGDNEENTALSASGLQTILNTLKERMHEIDNCFSLQQLNNTISQNLFAANLQIQEQDFYDIAIVLLYYSAEMNCTVKDVGMAKDVLLQGNTSLTKSSARALVKKLHDNEYASDEHTTKCFNAFSLMDGSDSSTEEIFVRLILYMFEGRCILPDQDFFADEFFEYLNATENGVVSKEAVVSFMTKIGIGQVNSVAETADGHDHDEGEQHDDGDEHDEDHSDGDEHDEDHSDGDEHDEDHSDGDEHDEDHSDGDEHDGDEHDEDHSAADKCYSASDLFAIFEAGVGNQITKEEIVKMCPAFLQQLASDSCKASEAAEPASNTTSHYTQAMIYGYGTAAVAVISLLALVGIIMFPVLNSPGYKMTMQFFVSLGVGTLTSDALLHIIPYILGLHAHAEEDEHDHEEEDLTYVWKMSVVLGGIYIFYLFENGLLLMKRRRETVDSSGDEYHNHGNHHTVTSFSAKGDEGHITTVSGGNPDISSSEEMLHKDEILCFGLTSICVMIFIGDVLHNFGDGLAIGVSFTTSWTQGVGSSLAIFCHELPHEFGDFAIYLKNGATKWKAILLNAIAACCSFIGLFIGINVAHNEEARQWLLAIIAGMFLYIALVDVMHEMISEKTENPMLQFLLQNLGLLIGWTILLLIAIYEEDLEQSIQQ